MRTEIQTKTIILRKAIFPLLFLFLFVGDWHLHTDFTHPCEDEHTSTHSQAKWHPHEACNDAEQDVHHDDLNTILHDAKTFASIPQVSNQLEETSVVGHEHYCRDCYYAPPGNILATHLKTTLLLI